MTITLTSDNTKLISTPAQIKEKIGVIATEMITRLTSQTEDIHLICILEGARKFSNALRAEIESQGFACKMSYIKTVGTIDTQLKDEIELKYGNLPKASHFKEQSVYVVDDLIDSGKTAVAICDHLSSLGYEAVQIVALFNKHKDCTLADIVGFDLAYDTQELAKIGVKDYWLFGYGMDLDGEFREMEEVKALIIPQIS